MGYQNFSTEDFIQDPDFVSWVKAPTEDSQVFWENWLTQHPDKQAIIEEARSFVLGLTFERHSLSEETKANMLSHIHQGIDKQPQISETPRVKSFSRIWMYSGIAAAILLLVLFIFRPSYTPYQNLYTTDFKESEQLFLPDGSEVKINANSTLSFQDDWEESPVRSLTLEKGEAFFSITPSENYQGKKFIVEAGEMNIEVLGTQFNVKKRPGKLEVVLTEGKVKILPKDSNKSIQDLDLLPGQMASYNFETQTLSKQIVNTRIYTAWKSQELFFEGTPLSELVEILQNSYGYEVLVKNPELLSEKLSGTVSTKAPETLLKGIELIYGIKIKRLGNKKIELFQPGS